MAPKAKTVRPRRRPVHRLQEQGEDLAAVKANPDL